MCAPIDSNTRAPLAQPAVAPPVQPAVQEADVQTMPIDSPDSQSAQPLQPALPSGRQVTLGLMLPLRSATLAQPAEILRAGFMAAHALEGAGFAVNLIETGDGGAQEALDDYLRAAQDSDIIVGPLSRPAVNAVAGSAAARKPTIALNHPDAGTPVPPNMLVIGLSIEDEARQAAAWVSREQPGANALIVSGASAWQRRIATAFADAWAKLGHESQLVELASGSAYDTEMAVGKLNAKVQNESPSLIFAALDPFQTRQVRGVIGNHVPFYGASSVNSRVAAGDTLPELDGMRMLDLPWVVQSDNATVMAYPRWTGAPLGLDMERLYALGIDAFRVAKEVALGRTAFELDGVTGRLKARFGDGSTQFTRVIPAAVFQAGTTRAILTQ
ncbi:penicillin-binding protein activator [Massilia sp. R798]|uniref:Penicillin-binding protein activator n=1 Tax=Massilia soli TaxID=2792854 RepID=A0ABS7SJC2_9BURK|nr:penicillin-binding protein activator [Massilia soli]